jgi:hypothetical protein
MMDQKPVRRVVALSTEEDRSAQSSHTTRATSATPKARQVIRVTYRSQKKNRETWDQVLERCRQLGERILRGEQ